MSVDGYIIKSSSASLSNSICSLTDFSSANPTKKNKH